MKTKSDTPLTEALIEKCVTIETTVLELARHARAMERDRARLIEALGATLHCLEWHSNNHGVGMDRINCEKARAALAAVKGD